MSTMSVDHRDVDRWVLRLDEAVSAAPEEATKVVAKGALNIKNGARQRRAGSRWAPAYPASIGYDMMQGLRGPVAEIGPDKLKRQGALGNILEFGTIHNAPEPHIRPAVDEEIPRYERAMTDLAARLLEGR
ncbi:hypothetical protein ACFHW1_04955 [Micromonospora sp. LOL_014]|uniref:hypothetical protein n=1 Tax=Micromonospora sp. LOL_014 TaxID=3345415 RepID=UPI003A85F1A0